MDVKITLPLLPLRDIVIFPSMVIPLFVGRDKSISALNEVMKDSKKIVLVTQKNAEIDDPKNEDIFSYGCESNILQLLKLPDGTVKVLVEGLKRVKITDLKSNEKFMSCSFTYQSDSLPKEEKMFTQDSTLQKKRERWHESLSKDVYVEEAVNVLNDLRMSSMKKSDWANIKN